VTSAQADWTSAPVIPRLDSTAKQRVVATLRKGRRMGNRADVFAKVGDSISQSPAFLQGLGCGRWTPGQYSRLRSTVGFFAARHLSGGSHDCPAANSFSRDSAATMVSIPSLQVIDPNGSFDSRCLPGEAPLACEIRLIRPAYALIMLGTNDVTISLAFKFDPVPSYVENLRQMIDVARRLGVVPVLSTIPPRADIAGADALVPEMNAALVGVATERHAPVINFWRALNPLPNRGLAVDGRHPSLFGGPDCIGFCDPDSCEPACQAANFTPRGLAFGYDTRNLITLQTLQRLSRLADTHLRVRSKSGSRPR
jgi:hypothetical protein